MASPLHFQRLGDQRLYGLTGQHYYAKIGTNHHLHLYLCKVGEDWSHTWYSGMRRDGQTWPCWKSGGGSVLCAADDLQEQLGDKLYLIPPASIDCPCWRHNLWAEINGQRCSLAATDYLRHHLLVIRPMSFRMSEQHGTVAMTVGPVGSVRIKKHLPSKADGMQWAVTRVLEWNKRQEQPYHSWSPGGGNNQLDDLKTANELWELHGVDQLS